MKDGEGERWGKVKSGGRRQGKGKDTSAIEI